MRAFHVRTLPLSSPGKLKMQNGRFPSKKCTSVEESLLKSVFV